MSPIRHSSYLKSVAASENLDVREYIKFAYRPFICPFDPILEVLDSSRSVYDIGCGHGALLAILSEFKSPEKLSGIEIDKKLVKSGERILRRALSGKKIAGTIALFDGHTIPSEVQTFDAVTMIDVVHHIPPLMRDDFFRSLKDQMKKGALLIIKDIDAGSPLVWCNRLHDLVSSGASGWELTKKNAIHYLTSFGFQLLTSSTYRSLWYPHYLLLLKKP